MYSFKRLVRRYFGFEELKDEIQNVHRVLESDLCYEELKEELRNVRDELESVKTLLVGMHSRSELCDRIARLHSLLPIKTVIGNRLIRVGKNNDGGYVMLDSFSPGMVAYSFGIGDDVSWDKHISSYGIDVYMYDNTILSLPEENKFFHWEKIGVCGNQPAENCKTVHSLLELNNHISRTDLLLKMDVEGAEIDSLLAMTQQDFDRFDQIVIELHDAYSDTLHSRICNVLEKLLMTHQPVHVHGNNWASVARVGKYVMPWALEILYVRKSGRNFSDSQCFFPREIDMPNNPAFSDIQLGLWNM